MHCMRVGGTIMGRMEWTGCHKGRVVQDSSSLSVRPVQNRGIMFCLELWYSEEKMQTFNCQHRKQHIFEWSYEISICTFIIIFGRLC